MTWFSKHHYQVLTFYQDEQSWLRRQLEAIGITGKYYCVFWYVLSSYRKWFTWFTLYNNHGYHGSVENGYIWKGNYWRYSHFFTEPWLWEEEYVHCRKLTWIWSHDGFTPSFFWISQEKQTNFQVRQNPLLYVFLKRVCIVFVVSVSLLAISIHRVNDFMGATFTYLKREIIKCKGDEILC